MSRFRPLPLLLFLLLSSLVVRPADSATLRGSVRLSGGDAAARVRVSAFEPASPFEKGVALVLGPSRTPFAVAETDAAGRFRLEAGERRLVELAIDAPGRVPFRRDVAPADPVGTLVLEPAPPQRGRVTAAGKPVAGALVVVWVGAEAAFAVKTGTDGGFELPEPGRWASDLTIVAAGAAPRFELSDRRSRRRRELPAAPAVIEIDVDPGEEVSGTIRTPEGAPAAGAVVSADGWPLARTGKDGRFAVRAAKGSAISARSGTQVGALAPGASEIRLAPGRTIRGRAATKDGLRPAVRVFTSLEERTGSAGWSAVSAADGTFRIDGLPPGRFALSARGPSAAASEPGSAIDLTRKTEASRELTLVAEGRLSGTVVDGDGRPVPGAWVSPAFPGMPAIYGAMPSMGTAMTDADGGFVLPQARRAAERLLGVARGYAAGEGAVPKDGSAPRIVLPGGVALRGRVRDDAGEPIGGVSIGALAGTFPKEQLLSLFSRGVPVVWIHESAADGTFELRVAPGVHQLGFLAEGRAPKILSFTAAAGTEPIDVVLGAGASIRGRLSSGAEGAGTHLWLRREETPIASTEADPDGSFEFVDLAPGPYSITIFDFASTEEPEPVDVVAPASDVRIEHSVGLRLTVTVVDPAGEPVPGARVGAEALGSADEPRWAEEAAPGELRFRGLEAGPVLVKVSASGFRSVSQETTLSAGAPAAPLHFRLERGASITGVVRNRAGGAIDGARIGVETPDGDDGRGISATSDDDGRFELSGLPIDELTIEVRKEGFRKTRRSLAPPFGPAPVEIVLEPGERLAGRVVDPDGMPVAEASLRASGAGVDGMFQEARSRADGAFELAGLAPGRVALTVRHEEFEEKKLDDVDVATAGHLSIRLVRRTFGRVHGFVRNLPEGSAMVQISASAADGWSGRGEAPGPDGAYRLEKVRAGEATIRATAYTGEGETVSRAVAVLVPSGGDVEANLDFAGGFEVRGRVTRNGEPERQATITFRRGNLDEGSTDTADSAGAYRITGLEAGSYVVTVWSSRRRGRSSEPESVEVAGHRTFDIDLTGASLAGRLGRAGSDAPVVGVRVEVESAVGHDSERVTTDSEGRFRFPELPAGRYVARASHPEYGDARVPFELSRGEAKELGLVLEKHAGLLVALVDARSGEALSGTVVARDEKGAVVFDGAPRRDRGGVRIPVPDGGVRVSASAYGYATRTVAATAPDESVRIPLLPGGSLVVISSRAEARKAKLIEPSGESYVRCWCNRIDELALAGKKTTFENIAAGAYTLVVEQKDGTESRHPVTVPEGGAVELAID